MTKEHQSTSVNVREEASPGAWDNLTSYQPFLNLQYVVGLCIILQAFASPGKVSIVTAVFGEE